MTELETMLGEIRARAVVERLTPEEAAVAEGLATRRASLTVAEWHRLRWLLTQESGLVYTPAPDWGGVIGQPGADVGEIDGVRITVIPPEQFDYGRSGRTVEVAVDADGRVVRRGDR